MALTLSAADVAVMNFRNILNSGSVLLALSYDTPVCVRAGSLRELFRRIGGDWLIELPQPLSAAALRQIIDRVKLAGIKRQQRRSPLYPPPISTPRRSHCAPCGNISLLSKKRLG